MIDYTKLARHLTKKLDVYIHANQVKRYAESHPKLNNQKYEDVFRAMYIHFLKYSEEIENEFK